MTTYHAAENGSTITLCGKVEVGDHIVIMSELTDTAGRHFNCVECHKVLSGGQKHVTPPEVEDD